MIEVRTGDILKNANTHALVNTVNCVGVMGKGVALAFKKRYPDMFKDYVRRCERAEVKLGRPYPYPAGDGHIIINFPTKDHWRGVSRLSDIVAGLDYLYEHYKEWGVRSIAVPPLGCGNGQLEWSVVGPTLFRGLSKFDIPVVLFAPLGTSPDQMQLDVITDTVQHPSDGSSSDEPFVEPAWIAIAEVVRRIESKRHHWPVGRTRLQKIAYFLTCLGVPTKLSYGRGAYGPYTPDLKAIESRLVNNGLLETARLGQMIAFKPGPTLDDAVQAYSAQLTEWEEPISRVTDLCERLVTRESEIAASVHLVAEELRDSLGRTPTEEEVQDEVLRWKPGRLSRRDIQVSVETMALLRWIRVEPSKEPAEEDDVELEAPDCGEVDTRRLAELLSSN